MKTIALIITICLLFFASAYTYANHSKCHSHYAPLLIDLGGDGFQLSKKGEGAFFSFDINNEFIYTQWVAKGTNDAFIVIDKNYTTIVDNSYELIGHGEILYGPKFKTEGYAKNGFEHLAVFDDPRRGGNNDKILSKEDEIWSIFKLWVDSDANGVSSQHELMPLSESELTEIDFSFYTENEKTDKAGNIFKNWSSAKGNERYQVVDVAFKIINLSKRHRGDK